MLWLACTGIQELIRHAHLYAALNAELCEAAFEALSSCNRSEEAHQVLQQMSSRGFRVTRQHFHRILAVCARLGQADKARQVWIRNKRGLEY